MVWSISFFLFWRSLRSLERERGMYIREPGESTSLFVTVASQNPMFHLIPFLSPVLLTSVGLSGPGGVWGGKKYQPLLLQGYSKPQPGHHSYSSLSGEPFRLQNLKKGQRWKFLSTQSFLSLIFKVRETKPPVAQGSSDTKTISRISRASNYCYFPSIKS